ncbi:MAG: hypothetical protein GEV03_15970 [Streptosporangiales bacterium]|nr:hypothetical protein [Streptosporangiales bacterium]
MVIETVLVSAANAMVAAVLINSGAAKLVSPVGLRGAAQEVVPAFGGGITDGLVRAVAGLELVTAAGLLVAMTRMPAVVFVALFGISFAALGAAGAIRGSTTECGCFGRTSGKPLGMTNFFIGLALLPVVLLNAWVRTVGAEYTANAVVLAALGSLLMCLWLNRRLASQLLTRRARRA